MNKKYFGTEAIHSKCEQYLHGLHNVWTAGNTLDVHDNSLNVMACKHVGNEITGYAFENNICPQLFKTQINSALADKQGCSWQLHTLTLHTFVSL